MSARWCAVVGAAVLAVAVAPPVDAVAARSFPVHMAQHLVVIELVAPLLALGVPKGWRFDVSLAVAVLVAAGTLWLWHVPSLYDAAVRSTPVHMAEHLTLLAGAVLFWKSVLRPTRTASVVPAVAVVAVGTAMNVLAALLVFAGHPLYREYASLAQQQLAGLLMWAPGGLVYLGVACALFVRWLRAMELPAAREGQPA